MQELSTKAGKLIRVYDDVLDFSLRQHIYEFATQSMFKIGWADGNIIENKKHQFLYSTYNNEDLIRLGILDALDKSVVKDEFVGYKLKHCILNLSTASDVNFVHAHPEDKVVLYYVNLEWHDGWHGETLFFDETQRSIEFGSPYTPGRIIAFDAKIPHTIRPQSHIAAKFRFTLALVLEKC